MHAEAATARGENPDREVRKRYVDDVFFSLRQDAMADPDKEFREVFMLLYRTQLRDGGLKLRRSWARLPESSRKCMKMGLERMAQSGGFWVREKSSQLFRILTEERPEWQNAHVPKS